MIGTNGQCLAKLRWRLGKWRQRRRRGSRIPEDLWQAAVQAARDYGVHRISEHLGLDYYSLKKRVTGAGSRAGSSGVEFVEIPGKVLSASPACVVELQDPQGLRLRVEVRNADNAEALAKALWSHRG